MRLSRIYTYDSNRDENYNKNIKINLKKIKKEAEKGEEKRLNGGYCWFKTIRRDKLGSQTFFFHQNHEQFSYLDR